MLAWLCAARSVVPSAVAADALVFGVEGIAMRLASEGTPSGRQVRWRRACLVAGVVLLATVVAACSRSGLRDPRADFFGERGGPFAAFDGNRANWDPRLGVRASPRVVSPGVQVPKGGGVYKIGKP